MNIEEAREIARMGWPENQKAQRQHDCVDWLISEVDRLTTVSNEPECQCCPECHCIEYVNKNLLGKGFRQCKKCGQEWWTDINYGKIDLHIKPLKTEVDRLTSALAEKEAECERLNKELQTDGCCRNCKEVDGARQSGIIEGREGMREEAAAIAFNIIAKGEDCGPASLAAAIRSIPITQEGK